MGSGFGDFGHFWLFLQSVAKNDDFSTYWFDVKRLGKLPQQGTLIANILESMYVSMCMDPWGGSTAGDVSAGCIPVVNRLRAMFPWVVFRW